MTIEITAANSSDAKNACEVLRRSIAEVCGPDYCQIVGFIEGWLHNKTPESVAEWIENPDAYFVVARATDAKEVVGVGNICRTGEILLCYVIPKYLGKGVGRDILASLECKAREWGIPKLTTYSTVTARHFYARQGFQQCASPVKDGGHEIEIPMAKECTT